MWSSIFLTVVVTSTFATQLLTPDHVEQLFRTHMRNELTEQEAQQFEDLLEILHRPEYASISSLSNSSPTRRSLDCLVCRGAFNTVFEGVKDNQTDEEITEVITTLCVNLGIANDRVCRGAIALNIPIITHIIKNTPQATPRSFCGHVLQTGGNPNFCRTEDTRFEWVVDLPPPSTSAVPPVVDTRPLKIALIADAHIDPLYEAGGVADCGEPTCCRKGQTLPQHFEYVSNVDESLIARGVVNVSGEVMLDLSVAPEIRKMRQSSRTRFAAARDPAPAGYWGDYRNCDTPLRAYDDVIDRIAETHKDVDLVYYIGDTIDHFVWETTYDLINNMNRYLIDKLRKSFGVDVLVVPTIGNHESQPTNQFAPSSVTEPKLNTTWLYRGLADKWAHYLNDEAKATLRDRGDFSVQARPDLRVISLNNNVGFTENWWLAYDPLDAKIHLDWLVSELHKAEQAGDKVHIITHTPPGSSSLTQTWTREYNRIVNRFTATIAGEFNGHSHADKFKIFYNAAGQPINMAWGVGSATSYSFYNLNYKIVEINTTTYEPARISTFVYNLTEANLTPNRRPHWFQLYDMNNSFVLSDLSPTSMNNLVRRMVTTDKHLLDFYAAFYYKLSDSRWANCNTNCKLNYVCDTVTTVLWQQERCNELRTLFNN